MRTCPDTRKFNTDQILAGREEVHTKLCQPAVQQLIIESYQVLEETNSQFFNSTLSKLTVDHILIHGHTSKNIWVAQIQIYG